MYIASSSTSVRFHSFPEGDLVYNYQPGTKVDGPVNNISWSKDGSWLSIVPKSGLAEIISVRNQLKLIHTIIDIEEPSCTAFQNTTKKFIAFGTKNGQVLVYDIKQKKIRNRFPRASSLISHIEFTARDTHLVAGCLNGEVHLYSNLTHALSSTLKIPRSESVSALKTNPVKRNFVIGGSNEGIVVVWDTNVNKHKFSVESHKAPVTGVAFSPNNPDLIISTGADRQFCCYDIISNKCIASVPVNNSMTAVDFSYDGTHFIMASQDGNISLYDSRRILEPVLVFEAHKSTIKNVAFQKQEMVNSNSSLLEDNVVSERHTDNDDEVVQNTSFGALLPNNLESEDVPDFERASRSPNIVDSFMAGLGLDGGNMSKYDHSETGEGDNCSDYNSFNKRQSESSNEEPKRLSLYNRRSLSIKQVSTSTPTPQVIVSKLEAAMSPIVNNMDENENIKEKNLVIPLDSLKKLVKEAVETELTEKFNTFTTEMKYQFSNTNAQMRREHLDLMMAMMKDFIKMENNMNSLREDLASNSPLSDNYLMEENLRLKKQIALLEEQLSKSNLD